MKNTDLPASAGQAGVTIDFIGGDLWLLSRW
jgi:hypothetical protein